MQHLMKRYNIEKIIVQAKSRVKAGYVFLFFLLIHTQEQSQADHKKFTKIFDGKTLNGWEGDWEIWSVKDGAIVGGSTTKKVAHNYFLTTKSSYGNFILKLKFKIIGIEGFINGGVQFHSQRIDNPPYEMSGYQADIGPGWWDVLYDESRRNVSLATPDSILISKIIKPEQWNEYEIHAVSGRIKLYLNGTQVVDYVEKDNTIPQKGFIGLQVHGGGKLLVMYKDVKINLVD